MCVNAYVCMCLYLCVCHRLPETMAFSIAVPRFCRSIKSFITKYYDYAAYLGDLSTVMQKVLLLLLLFIIVIYLLVLLLVLLLLLLLALCHSLHTHIHTNTYKHMPHTNQTHRHT